MLQLKNAQLYYGLPVNKNIWFLINPAIFVVHFVIVRLKVDVHVVLEKLFFMTDILTILDGHYTQWFWNYSVSTLQRSTDKRPFYFMHYFLEKGTKKVTIAQNKYILINKYSVLTANLGL